MRVWPPRSSATLLLCLGLPLVASACSFSSPDGSDDDAGGDDMPACLDGDADGDTVCNIADKCPGHNDRVDVDNDGMPDGCDDWPCGVMKPDSPDELMSDSGSEGRKWYASFINIGMDRRIVVTAGQPFNARFTWGLDVDCGSDPNPCRAQVEIGYGATRTGCVYDGNVPDEALFVRTYDAPLTAPATPGAHELRLNAGRRTACGDSTQPWYGGDPGSESTIAILCVK